MKTFFKILIAIIVVAALCGGVYLVLPETAQIFVKGYFQYKTDDAAKEKIDSLKKNEIKYAEVQKSGVEKTVNTGVTYGDALTKKAKTSVWYYEESTNGGFTITYYGTKVSMDLAKFGSDGTYIDKTLKIVFAFPAEGKSTVTIYIGDQVCDDATKSAALQALAY